MACNTRRMSRALSFLAVFLAPAVALACPGAAPQASSCALSCALGSTSFGASMLSIGGGILAGIAFEIFGRRKP